MTIPSTRNVSVSGHRMTGAPSPTMPDSMSKTRPVATFFITKNPGGKPYVCRSASMGVSCILVNSWLRGGNECSSSQGVTLLYMCKLYSAQHCSDRSVAPPLVDSNIGLRSLVGGRGGSILYNR